MAEAGLTCRHLVELLTDYLDGALTPETAARVEGHLRSCPGCARYLEQFRLTIDVIGCLRGADPAPEMRDRLLAVSSDWEQSR